MNLDINDKQKIVLLIIIGGFSFWALDAALDVYVFGEDESFWGSFIFEITLFEAYIRSIVWILLIVIGILFYKMLQTTRKNEQDKIELIIRMNKSISHDLRNPLSSISNAVYVLKDVKNEKVQKMLKIINKSVDSSVNLLEGLIDYESESKLQLAMNDLNLLIKNVLSGITISDNIKTNMFYDKIPNINVDQRKIERAICNIMLNSLQAMTEGGELHISTKKTEKSIKIVIQDTGKGISKENIPKLFTSYFTTKSKGIGLGLVNVKKIIDAHKGTIKIESTEGKGTTTTITLPMTK